MAGTGGTRAKTEPTTLDFSKEVSSSEVAAPQPVVIDLTEISDPPAIVLIDIDSDEEHCIKLKDKPWTMVKLPSLFPRHCVPPRKRIYARRYMFRSTNNETWGFNLNQDGTVTHVLEFPGAAAADYAGCW
ncbi:hypothetical protein H257_12876 [Aphanomyces astaci]|uniref:Uncharacterized protein n=1 Tax=Aphanomyces astaci TaxID=112090 RepID=W4FX78_APHAT|nr:hypothetical protein H257_12876 [Aphanomyces astaci]ETV72092.1 hypothetical protein H257_12876 [Aphanomyces astaci]|eukprot:XP_009838535.1 hypothetical protein H257_12876 [Aphanomyces astaci]